MNIRVLNKISVALSAAFMCLGAVLAEEKPERPKPERPNIVFLLVDDLGWADLGCYGSTFHETPNIDKLAESGVRFTHAYASGSVCTPTRVSILTGRNPVRVGVTDWIPGYKPHHFSDAHLVTPEIKGYLPAEEVTFAESLKEHNYQTYFVGKWHVSGWKKGENVTPTDQGFDVNIGGWQLGAPKGGYYSPWGNPTLKDPEKRTYLTEYLTDQSIDLIRNRDKEKPFILYHCYYAVHGPIEYHEGKKEYYDDKRRSKISGSATNTEEKGFGVYSKSRQDNAAYATMVSAVDDSVGKIVKYLEDQGLMDNTYIIIGSDNGGVSVTFSSKDGGVTSNKPLRAGKGWLTEGGIRVPLIISGPGLKKGQVNHAKVISTDFFPTILDMANLPQRPELHCDGQSMIPLMNGKKESIHDTLYWYYPHYTVQQWKPGSVILDGDWKLINFEHWGQIDLYNLKDDPSERNNLASVYPERVKQLKEKLDLWLKEMNAKPLREMTAEELKENKKMYEKWGIKEKP